MPTPKDLLKDDPFRDPAIAILDFEPLILSVAKKVDLVNSKTLKFVYNSNFVYWPWSPWSIHLNHKLLRSSDFSFLLWHRYKSLCTKHNLTISGCTTFREVIGKVKEERRFRRSIEKLLIGLSKNGNAEIRQKDKIVETALKRTQRCGYIPKLICWLYGHIYIKRNIMFAGIPAQGSEAILAEILECGRCSKWVVIRKIFRGNAKQVQKYAKENQIKISEVKEMRSHPK